MREAELNRVLNGSRRQERGEALASVREAEAIVANAKAEMLRRESRTIMRQAGTTSIAGISRDYVTERPR